MTRQEVSAANDCYFEEAARGWFWKSERNHKDLIGTSTKCTKKCIINMCLIGVMSLEGLCQICQWHSVQSRGADSPDSLGKCCGFLSIWSFWSSFQLRWAIYLQGAGSLQGREHQHQSDSKQKCCECTSSTWNWICCVVFRRRWLANPGSGGLSREM